MMRCDNGERAKELSFDGCESLDLIASDTSKTLSHSHSTDQLEDIRFGSQFAFCSHRSYVSVRAEEEKFLWTGLHFISLGSHRSAVCFIWLNYRLYLMLCYLKCSSQWCAILWRVHEISASHWSCTTTVKLILKTDLPHSLQFYFSQNFVTIWRTLIAWGIRKIDFVSVLPAAFYSNVLFQKDSFGYLLPLS